MEIKGRIIPSSGDIDIHEDFNDKRTNYNTWRLMRKCTANEMAVLNLIIEFCNFKIWNTCFFFLFFFSSIGGSVVER